MASLAHQVSQAPENSWLTLVTGACSVWIYIIHSHLSPDQFLVSHEVHSHYMLPTMTISLSTSPQRWGQVIKTRAFAIGIKYSLHFVRLAFSDILSVIVTERDQYKVWLFRVSPIASFDPERLRSQIYDLLL